MDNSTFLSQLQVSRPANDEFYASDSHTLHAGRSAAILDATNNEQHLNSSDMQTSHNEALQADISKSKRTDIISWEEYFMSIAALSGMRSKDPNTQVGACIVNTHKRVVATGYNGFPNNFPGLDNDEVFPWSREGAHNKYNYVVHAEANALLNRNHASVEGCTMYTTLFPCSQCAAFIVQSRIAEVIYASDKHAGAEHKALKLICNQASKRMLDAARIPYRKFESARNQIVIDFEQLSG